MKSRHLSDSEIQEYVLDQSKNISVAEHLLECEACKTRMGIYQQIMIGIKAQQVVEFDFNISELVLTKIEKKSPVYSYTNLFWLFAILGVNIIALTGYLFGKYIAHLFSGAAGMSIYLAITIAVGIFLFLAIDMIRKYKRQMEAVNFS